MAGPSIIEQFLPRGWAPIEGNEVDAAITIPYRIPNLRVEWRRVPIPVPLGVWRSVAQSQNLFAVESFIDELASAAKRDAGEYRRAMLESDPRLRNVLDIATSNAGWGRPRAPGAGQGIALNRYGENFAIALVASVQVQPSGGFRVRKLTCAVDCGQAVNPLSVRAQIEGGLVWGLSAALYGRITVRDGQIEQSNFHDYRVLRIDEMPELDIHLVDSHTTPGGIGEPCAPPVAPAVANALFAATGVRIRTQPFPDKVGAPI
jgi:isoquinoline 1-oxidoreductase beta subunit